MAKKDAIEQIEIEAPYELPEGWRWKTLGNTCDMYQPKTISTKELIDDGKYLVYGANGVIGRYDKYNHEKAQLLITCRGATCGAVNISEPFSWINGNAMVINPKDENLDLKYLAYIFQSEVNFNKVITGSAQPQITRQSLLPVIFPLPPTLAEQQRIVNRIETMFEKLDQAQEKAQVVLDSFETRKAAILHKAFTGELTANWRKENGVADDSWEEKLFDSCIAKMQNGISKRSGSEGEETVVLRLANIGENDFDVSDLRTIKLTSKEQDNYSLTRDDVVMIRVNGSKTNVGRQILVKNNNGWSFCDHIIRIKYETFCMPSYMVYFSHTKEYKDYVQDNMVSSAGQNTISRKGLSNLTLKIPSLPEQQEIVRILDNVLEKETRAKEAAGQVLEQIALLKKSILARAFRGEL